jgi:hypothetical protein
MGAETKKTMGEVCETFKKIVKEADDAGRKAASLDKELAGKIHQVKQVGEQIVKHISERVEK